MIETKAVFYGVVLDQDDAYLERNLARLEKRFLSRYQASLEKEQNRNKQGKPAHATTLKSIHNNKERLETVRSLCTLLSDKQER